jgi:hypothetical protein
VYVPVPELKVGGATVGWVYTADPTALWRKPVAVAIAVKVSGGVTVIGPE